MKFRFNTQTTNNQTIKVTIHSLEDGYYYPQFFINKSQFSQRCESLGEAITYSYNTIKGH